ncbi:hypothetical protein [Sinobaca sp. H24]|uniref:hypothetical protein n=1 Tax=Sinobaca sp. H24 TaxID=2923376 RepID=UPI0035ADAA65
MKGLEIGGAKISNIHANWIENNGRATAKDIVELINYVKKEVENKTGYKLVTEVIYIK